MAAALLPSHRIAYFAIPKSASTSMKLALYKLREGRQWCGDPDGVHKQFPTFPLKAGDIAQTDGWWRFTILRDPVQRLLSAYGNRVQFHGDIESDAAPGWRAKLLFRRHNRGLRLRPTADEFFSDLHRYQAISYSIWHHTTSATTFIGEDLSIFDRVYRLEDIPLLETELEQRVGRRVSLPHEQAQGDKVAFDDLGGRARKAVLTATQRDYQLLSGVFEPPQ